MAMDTVGTIAAYCALGGDKNVVRLAQLDKAGAASLRNFDCLEFDSQPWIDGPPLNHRRVALISTAGLHRRDDNRFTIQYGRSRLARRLQSYSGR